MRESYVYVIAEASIEADSHSPVFMKIGVASRPLARLKGLQVGNPRKLEMVSTTKIPTRDGAFAMERILHGILSEDGVSGEWFLCLPSRVLEQVVDIAPHFCCSDTTNIYKYSLAA